MSKITSYKELIVWQKSFRLTKEIYLATEKFPRSELFGLTSQMRRCALSIPSNIAEGFGRRSSKEYSQFLYVAFGSGLELETQLLLARDLHFLSQKDFDILNPLLGETLRMLNKMKSNISLLITKV